MNSQFRTPPCLADCLPLFSSSTFASSNFPRSLDSRDGVDTDPDDFFFVFLACPFLAQIHIVVLWILARLLHDAIFGFVDRRHEIGP
ncbi:hypothetical protein TNCV_4079341 [Trichonephila clavipes]|nr:hypothetical protein TNCV_4079341 [Trichonephila clavipes]